MGPREPPANRRTAAGAGEHTDAVALFAPDGNHAYAIFHDGRGYRWDVRPSAWNDQACAVAGRRLSRAEWHELLPGRDYAPAC